MVTCTDEGSGRLKVMADLDRNDPSTWPFFMKIEEVAAVLDVGRAVVDRLILGPNPRLRSVLLSSPEAQRDYRRITKKDLLQWAMTTDSGEESPDEET